MKILVDKFKGEHLRTAFAGIRVVRCETNGGQTRLMKVRDYMKLLIENGVYDRNEMFSAAVEGIDFQNKN